MSSAQADTGEDGLLEVLRARIRRDGPMPVEAYMQACLADPEHGYWRQAAGTIGADGDFITAPEISQVFGELIGLWCGVVWQSMGRPAGVHLIELGPGRGTLLRDGLRAGRAVPGFLQAAAVHLVEISAPLREMQRQALAPFSRSRRPAQDPAAGLPGVVGPRLRGDDVEWHERLGEVPPGPAIIIGNEFLDALPIRQLVFAAGAWRERVVELDGQEKLRFGLGATVDRPEADWADTAPPPDAILELRAGESELIAELAGRQAPVAALLIDYGPAEAGYGETLQAVRRHAYGDPLATPGSADLTAHVQFGRLARQARAAGLAVDGPITQAEFLGALGAAERAARLMAANPAEAGSIETGVQRLLSPAGMGQLFKAMVIRSPDLPPPAPFG